MISATSPTSQRRSSRWHGMPAGCGTQRASYTPSPPPSAADLDRRPRPVRHRPCVPGRREPSDRVVDVTVPTSVWERGRATQRPWCHSTSACPGSHVTAPPSAVPTCRHLSAPVPPLSALAAGRGPLSACPAARVPCRPGRETTRHSGRAPGRAERWHGTCTRVVQQQRLVRWRRHREGRPFNGRPSAVADTGGVIATVTAGRPNALAAQMAGEPAFFSSHPSKGAKTMSTITTKDGVEIFYKDWGSGQAVVLHHGWPLSSDDWDAQVLYLVEKGYRVVAHDRRGHGRSSQVSDGHDMDHYAADVAAVVEHLNLRDAIHIGHSTGGGEATRYVARHGKGRVAKLVLIGAVPPIMVQTPANPDGLPIEVFDGFRKQLTANRAQYYLDIASGPFYSYNRPGAHISQGVIQNWWRQGMMGGAKAHYDSIKAFSETDFTEDLKIIDVPTLVMHGDDDQIVPIADSALLSAKLLRKGTLKVYETFPHGMCTTHADVINADLLVFIKS